jgi:hypothetical protein
VLDEVTLAARAPPLARLGQVFAPAVRDAGHPARGAAEDVGGDLGAGGAGGDSEHSGAGAQPNRVRDESLRSNRCTGAPHDEDTMACRARPVKAGARAGVIA